MSRLEVQTVPIDSIQPNSYNPNRQTPEQFSLLLESMRVDGFTQPIVVQEASRTIVDGEHRWRACKALGRSMIPVVFVNLSVEAQLRSTLQHNWARGKEDASLAAVVMRKLLEEITPEELADQLKVSVEDIKLELKVHLPDVSLEELFPEFDGGSAIPPEIADLLRRNEGIASQKLLSEEKTMKAGDQVYFFVSYTFTEEEGRTVIQPALDKMSPMQPEAFMAICRMAAQKGW